jgi:Tol biopolymer transport system component
VDASDPARRLVRARLLKDGSTVTMATGDVGAPVWQADSRHVFVIGQVDTKTGPAAKVFRLGLGDSQARSLTAAGGMPVTSNLRVLSLSPSADGHQLALIAESAGRQAVWVMNADGTGLTQLSEYDPDGFPYSCRAAAWTPT